MSQSFGLVLFASAALKAFLALAFADLPLRYDELVFLEAGQRMAGGEINPFRAPGYQAFVALGLTLSGGSLIGVRLLQVVVSVATCAIVYRTTLHLAGERAALAAGTFLAFYPSHVAYSHWLWAVTLFLLPVVAAFDRLIAADRQGSWRTAALAGALLGAASLVRSVGLVLLAASCVWMWRRSERRGVLVAALVGAAALVILPWSIHASLRAERPILIDGNAGFNLFSGNNRWIPPGLQGIWGVALPLQNGVEPRRAEQLERKGADRGLAWLKPESGWVFESRRELQAAGIGSLESPEGGDWSRRHAREEIARDPLGALARVPLKLSAWWSPDFFLPRHLLRDWYGPLPPALAALLAALAMGASAVPLLLGLAALAALPPSRFRALAALWLGFGAVLHALAFGVSRMHQPFVPLLVMAVALMWAGPGAAIPWRRVGRRAAPALAIGLSAWIVSAPVVMGLYVSPGPRHLTLARWLGALGETPLPGARYATWMRAQVVAAAGDEREAERLLSTSRHADHPWTLVQRAFVSDRPRMRPLVEQAFATGSIVGFERENVLARLPDPSSPQVAR